MVFGGVTMSVEVRGGKVRQGAKPRTGGLGRAHGPG